jgi:cold shock protein
VIRAELRLTSLRNHEYFGLSKLARRCIMAVGRVKWFNDEKGWGFIKQDTGPDVFVHYSQISGEGRKRLAEDELVQFEVTEGPKGLQAVNVQRDQAPAN